jgi:hypothetical protein
MHALIVNNKIKRYPYSLGEYASNNPQVSLPSEITPELLTELGLIAIAKTPVPSHDSATQYLKEEMPEAKSGVWHQVWSIQNRSQTEIEEIRKNRLESVNQQRLNVYREEADPLFFKAQRGEVTMEEWQAKVLEIKARFPKPE